MRGHNLVLRPDRLTDHILFDFDGLPTFADGFVKLVLGCQCVGEVVIRHRELGIELDGLAVFGDALFQLAVGSQ